MVRVPQDGNPCPKSSASFVECFKPTAKVAFGTPSHFDPPTCFGKGIMRKTGNVLLY